MSPVGSRSALAIYLRSWRPMLRGTLATSTSLRLLGAVGLAWIANTISDAEYNRLCELLNRIRFAGDDI